MTATVEIPPDVEQLAKLLAREQAAQFGLAITELLHALQPARKERPEAAQRVTLTTVVLEQSAAAPVAPAAQMLVGNGRTEQRSRVTLWCNTAATVFVATERGGLTSQQTRVQLVPLVPIVFLNCSQLYASSTDAASNVSLIIEEYDE